MPRKTRIEYPGAIYHAIHRGNNQRIIFKEAIDKNYFLKKLRHYKQKLNYELFAYALMNNHYHLLIRTNAEPLSVIMHRINSCYGRYFNSRYKHSGHVFQDRYKAYLVEDDSYLFALLRYIHQNPAKAGLVAKSKYYKWCSDRCYRWEDADELVDTDFIMRMLATDVTSARKRYSKLMEQEDVYGVDKMFAFEDVEIDSEPTTVIADELDSILKEVAPDQSAFKLIKTGSRKKDLIPIKAAYVNKAKQEGYSYAQIGESIGLSKSAAHNLSKRQS